MKFLLTSRKFWAGLIGLTLIFVLAFFPNFPEIGNQVTDITVVVAAYVIGTALDPKLDWKNKLLEVFKSTKFWAAFAGLGFIIVKQFVPNLPFTEEQVTGAIITLSTFIIGRGVQDKLLAGMKQ
jgi:hypothetical protein